MDTTKDFARLATDAIGGRAEGERLDSTLEAVEADMARLSRTQESLRCVIAEFSLYTEGFVAHIARAGEELARLRGLADRLKAAGSELRELKASLQASAGPASAGAAAPKRPQER